MKGCTTLAQARSLCGKHGAYGKCQFAGCTTGLRTITDSRCGTHGGSKKKSCSVAGCTTPSARKGLCAKHGGGMGLCFISGCPNKMVYAKLMTCKSHGGGSAKVCRMKGCATLARAQGLCAKHGGGKGRCWIKGCTNVMVSRLKTCRTHGGLGYCSLPECWTPALKAGSDCTKHTSK